MTFLEQIISQIAARRYLPRNLIGVGAVIAVIAAVLFAREIGSLLNPPSGSKASVAPDPDLEKIWSTLERDGAEKAAHSKMVAVNQGGKRWLYVAGGIDLLFNVTENRYQQTILDNVRRIEIDSKGNVVGDAWEGDGTAWGSTNFGHAEFGFVQVGNYLYVVSGDINVPKVVENQNQSALLYSTIERLNLTSPNNGWEVFALLSGVNFYPEVVVDGDNIHVVGGVYGNPFPPINDDVAQTYNTDMIDISGDYALWESIKNKTVIGGTGLFLNHTQENGGI